MQTRRFYVAPILVMSALTGCFRDKPEVDLTRVSVGMEKQEVLSKLGKPTRVAVQGTIEYLEYEAYENSGWDWQGKRNYRWMFVRLVNGRVESFGRKGDFDSTKNPTTDLNINQRIESKSTTTANTTSPTQFDLKAELEKLEKMRKDGLITEQEHQQLRQRAIDKAKVQ
jgi:outer membrane protein assembly factor BamE (lipoprotein component of BamABCDE complex)